MRNEYDDNALFEEYAKMPRSKGGFCFELQVAEEAAPPKEMMDIPGMKDELRRPMMLSVKSIAKKAQ